MPVIRRRRGKECHAKITRDDLSHEVGEAVPVLSRMTKTQQIGKNLPGKFHLTNFSKSS